MQVLSIPVVILSVSVIAVACTKKPEEPAEEPQVGAATEEPPPRAAGHRLELGIDGDPGYTQKELTPAELAKVRAEGERAPEPSYAGQPSQPSGADQPSEPSDVGEPSEVSEEYLGDRRYMERRREPLPVERRREPLPVERERDPVRTEPARGGRR